jgi:hypothetical protein
MDKLAMWQLLRSIDDHGINASGNDKQKDNRDWMQVFCEEVIQETCVHSRHLARLLPCAEIHPGILGFASYNQISVNCFKTKSSDTPFFLMTRTWRAPHQTTKSEKRSVRKPYQPHRLALGNLP